MTEETRDERLWRWYGHLALLNGDFLEAEETLKRALAFPWAGENTRNLALLDLACVHARAGRDHEARNALERAHAIRPLDPGWLATDPDLTPVRDLDWFRELIAGA